MLPPCLSSIIEKCSAKFGISFLTTAPAERTVLLVLISISSLVLNWLNKSFNLNSNLIASILGIELSDLETDTVKCWGCPSHNKDMK